MVRESRALPSPRLAPGQFSFHFDLTRFAKNDTLRAIPRSEFPRQLCHHAHTGEFHELCRLLYPFFCIGDR